ncbi:MAG: BON domain-containing protein [Desulfuromonadales bacterium]|nr:BON domain-containing protein [Desulfuromonadales bacterium]
MQKLAGGLIALILLVVFSACGGTETRRSAGTYIDDKTISTQVNAALARDPVAKATQVQVQTYEGVVQLSGFVDSQENKQRSEELAREVNGVRDVRNNIVVRQTPPQQQRDR